MTQKKKIIKKTIPDIKLESVNLVESHCDLKQRPTLGARGMLRAQTNAKFALLEGEKEKIEKFSIAMQANVNGYNNIEKIEDASPQNLVFEVTCMFEAIYNVINGTKTKSSIDNITPQLYPYLNYIIREHIDCIVYKMGLQGSFVSIPLVAPIPKEK